MRAADRASSLKSRSAGLVLRSDNDDCAHAPRAVSAIITASRGYVRGATNSWNDQLNGSSADNNNIDDNRNNARARGGTRIRAPELRIVILSAWSNKNRKRLMPRSNSPISVILASKITRPFVIAIESALGEASPRKTALCYSARSALTAHAPAV